MLVMLLIMSLIHVHYAHLSLIYQLLFLSKIHDKTLTYILNAVPVSLSIESTEMRQCWYWITENNYVIVCYINQISI